MGMLPSQEDATYKLLGVLTWMDITSPVAELAGSIARRFHRSHQGIDTADYLIAAVAIELGAQLVTLNVRHFPMFPNLVPPFRLN
jgi:predicted nucleic acid-binding protein